ncbi:MAG: hypothetical protein FKY71_11355 [Spiribacter salinus]|uniref:Scaffolding protein n=1 Tax=Spiribacter salinus TaxID=1335746 RepID=A0A540VQ62_9GAMM|nr:MAG: hypothetical protein FKY71_11355 [Spiribacter salinus]
MPLTDEQTALLKEADPDDLADGLEKYNTDAFQNVFRRGYGKAKGDLTPSLSEKDEALTAAQQRAQALEEKVSKLQEEAITPDEAQQMKEEALRKKAEEFEEKYQGLNQKLQEERQDKVQQRVRSELTNHVPQWVADRALNHDVQKRIKVSDDGITIYEQDGETPMGTSTDDAMAKLVEDVVAGIPEQFRTAAKQNGTGYKGGGSGGGNSAGRYKPDMSTAQKAQLAQELGVEGYRKAKEQHQARQTE